MRHFPSQALLASCRKGIIFSAPMVIAILRGVKTVTRRIDLSWLSLKPGDLLYVRETIVRDHELGARYAADRVTVPGVEQWPWQNNTLPSIHLPRAHSRLVLRVTEPPSSERLQDITEADARNEGAVEPSAQGSLADWRALDHFKALWEHLHGNPGERWIDNPELVRIPFELVEEN